MLSMHFISSPFYFFALLAFARTEGTIMLELELLGFGASGTAGASAGAFGGSAPRGGNSTSDGELLACCGGGLLA